MRSMQVAALLLVTALCCCGCGPKKPYGIPKLHPTTVTILKDSAPVVKANVFLVPAEGTVSGSWATRGLTNESGVATIETAQGDWKAPGAPEGQYRVYLTKVAEIEEPEVPADMGSNPEAEEAYYAERLKRLEAANTEIAPNFTSDSTSGLTITVAAGAGASETFDIGSGSSEE